MACSIRQPEAGWAHLDGGQGLLKLVLGHVHKLAGPLVRGCIGYEVQRREARLPPRGHKHQHWLHRRMQLQGAPGSAP